MINLEGKQILFFSDIEDIIKILTEKIKKIGFKPPLFIYGIPRGGLIPAVLLSHRTGIEYKQPVTQEDASNTLIVDDICDSGETLEKIKEKYPNCLTLTLFTLQPPSIQPDIYGKVVGDEWIEFPWEMHTALTERDKTKF